MGMFSSDFWDEYYAEQEKYSKRFDGVRRNNSDMYGGHRDGRIDEQMLQKNLETDGGYFAKVSGNVGELTLSSVLGSLPEYYHILDNILLQTKKGSTQLDHVIVSPFGIFVIETKNHKGMIFGDCLGQVWTQVLPGKGRFKLYSPVLQNQGHINHLSKQSGIPMQFMQGVIVFTNKDANLMNVNCPFCFNVDSLYSYIMSFDRPIFNEKQMYQIIKRLDKINTDGYLNRQKHVDYVNKNKQRRGY